MEIRLPLPTETPAERPASAPTSSSTASAAVRSQTPVAADGFAREAAAAASTSAPQSLAPVAPPAVPLSEETLRGAASFAVQLNQLGSVGLNEEDLLARFLKLQVNDDRQEIESTSSLTEAATVFAQMNIMIAKNLQQRMRDNPENASYLRMLFAQVDRDLGHVLASFKESMQRSLEATKDKKAAKEDRSVGDPKKKRQHAKPGLGDMPVEVAAGISSTVASFGDGGALSVPSFEKIRGDVARSVSALVLRHESLTAGKRSG